jgi:hypothetical protein
MAKIHDIDIKSDTFNSLTFDWNKAMQMLLHDMESYESEEADLVAKVKVKLNRDTAPDNDFTAYEAKRNVTVPKFEHTVTSTIKVKDERKGFLSGNYELIWDAGEHKYIMVEQSDGQTTFYGDDEKNSNAKPSEPREPLGLPPADVTPIDYDGDYIDADYEYADDIEGDTSGEALDDGLPLAYPDESAYHDDGYSYDEPDDA